MLNKEEKNHWKDYKKKLLEGIEDQISRGNNLPAAKLVCCAIDALAGFYVGLTQSQNDQKPKYVLQGGSRNNSSSRLKNFSGISYEKPWHKETFTAYIKNYIGKLFRNNYGVDFYDSYRNSLIHEGMSKKGYGIENLRNGKLFIKNNNKILLLNINELFKELKNSIKLFDQELGEKDYRVRRWRERYKYLQGNLLEE